MSRTTSLLAALALSLTACASPPPPEPPRGADVLIVNALPSRDGDALLVRGNDFFSGTEAELRAKADPAGLQVLDARGGRVLPAFTDAHAHLLLGGLAEGQVKLNGLKTLDECLEAVRRWAEEHPDAPWVLGGGWGYGIVPQGEFPSRQALDRVVPDRPAILDSYDGHSAWANTRALALAEVSAATPDPENGRVVREADGETPQGTLLEDAAGLVHEHVPEPGAAAQRAAIELALRQFLRLGITTVHTMCGSIEEVAHYEALLAAGELPLDVVVLLPLETPLAQALAVRERLARPELRFGGLKGFLDGVIESKTACMLEPYVGGGNGTPNYTRERLQELVSAAHAEGIPVALHAIGDAAVRMALDAYEAAGRTPGHPRVRHRIEHLEVVHPDDYPRFAALDVVASMQPYHAVPADAPSPDDVWSANLGPERLARAFPWRALREAGALVVFGSDWNVFTQDPLKGLAVAITRQNERGLPEGGWQPHQRLTLTQAVLAYTVHPHMAEPAQASPPARDWVVLSPDVRLADPRTLWAGKVRAVVRRGQLHVFD